MATWYRIHIRMYASRSAYTLIELLIVIMIAVMLMVISLPVLKSVMEDARPREASRVFNTTIVTAKARAAQSGRLAGIEFVLQRMNDPMATLGAFQCTQMYLCEVPPPYMGDTTNEKVVVNTSVNPWTLAFQGTTDTNLASLLDSTNSFEIRIDHRGNWYDGTYNPMTTSYTFQPKPMTSAVSPPSTDPNGYVFHIRRPPVRVGNPVELPKSTAIDMVYSGLGPRGWDFRTITGLRIMFAPGGNIEEMYGISPGSGITKAQPTGTVHFLVGLTTKVNSPREGMAGPWNINDFTKSNLADENALWVSIGRSSGIVTTNENAPDATRIPDPSVVTQQADYLEYCRQYATAREQKGGR